ANFFALGPCILNVLAAASYTLRASGGMPLKEFVDIYVHLRHPHHYDPRSWPVALWVSFLWPIIPAMAACGIVRSTSSASVRRNLGDAARVFLLICVLLVVAFLGAGFWYISENLVQMSLYRFSIYLQLLACIGAALLICDTTRF